MKLPWLQIAIISSALLIGGGCYWITGHPDHPIEQLMEAILRKHGVDIDFSLEN